MYLLELAAQNVGGLSPTVRVALKPGYLVLQPPGGGQAPLGGLLLALCYPDGRGGDAVFAAQGQRAEVGITVLGNDQNTYRVLRELGGPGSLSRLNKASGTWEVVTEDSADMAQFLRGQAGFPSRGTFEQLFAFSASQLPSRRPKKGVPLGASGPKPSLATTLPSAMAVSAASDVAAAEEKARQLEEELRTSKEVDELQFKLDGIASQIFELESKLQGGEGLRTALEAALREHERAPSPEQFNLPADIVQRAEQYPQLEQRRDELLARLDAEAPAEQEPHVPYVEPLTKDQKFLGAMAAGILFLGAGLFMEGAARYVALLDIPAFSFAALLALRFVDDKEHAQKTTRRGGMREKREKKIRDDFEADARVVKDALSRTSVHSPSELVELFSQKALLLQRVEEYRQQLEAFEQDPEYQGALEASAQLKAQQEAMNEELTQKGAYVRDAREVERELGRVRESIQLAKAGPAPAAAAAPAAAPAPGEPVEDLAPLLLSNCTDLLQTDVPTLATAVKDRIAQYLAALTDRRLVGVEFDTTGKATAVNAQGQRVPATSLAPRDADILYLATRLTLIERVSARQKLPFLIEDALPVDDAKHALMARMVKHIGTLTQVVHVTSLPPYLQASDAQLAL